MLKSIYISIIAVALSFTYAAAQGNYSSWDLTSKPGTNVVCVFTSKYSPTAFPSTWNNCAQNSTEITTWYDLGIVPGCGTRDTSFAVKGFSLTTPTWHYYYLTAKTDTAGFRHTFISRDRTYKHYAQYKDYGTGKWVDLVNGTTIPTSAFVPTSSRVTDSKGYQQLVYIRVRGKIIPPGKNKRIGGGNSDSDEELNLTTSVDYSSARVQMNQPLNGTFEVYTTSGQMRYNGSFNNGEIEYGLNGISNQILIFVIKPNDQTPIVEKVMVP